MFGKIYSDDKQSQRLVEIDRDIRQLCEEVDSLLSKLFGSFEARMSEAGAKQIKVGGENLAMITPNVLKNPFVLSPEQKGAISQEQLRVTESIDKLYEEFDEVYDSKSRVLSIITQLAHKKNLSLGLKQNKLQVDINEEDGFFHTNNLERQQLLTENINIQAPINFLEKSVKEIKDELKGFHIALHDQIKFNNYESVEFLLKCGANPGFVYEGKDCVERAYSLGDDKLLKLVISHSNKDFVNDKLPDGRTLLRWAFDKKDTNLFRSLMSAGAELLPDAKGDEAICYGPTLLHDAAAQGNDEIVSIVLMHSSQAINAARQDNNSYVQRFLGQLCCTVTGETPLHCAVKAYMNARQSPALQASALNIIKLLSEKGAKVDVKDQNGMTVRSMVDSVTDKSVRNELNEALYVVSEGKKAR